jgi:multidrug resistance efflux pump
MPPNHNTALTVVEIPRDLQAPIRADYSSSVQEVLGRTPPWLLRSGTNVVAAVVAVLLLLSWLIHYPDSIRGKITITGANPAVAVVARQSGQLERLCVKEGERVNKGHLLGVIANPADTNRVLRLKDELHKLQPFFSDPSTFIALNLSDETQLGAVQIAYSDFYARYRQYDALLHDDYAERTAALLQRQLDQKHMEADQMQQETKATQRQTALAQENLNRMAKLHKQRAISTAELQTQERQLLDQKKQGAIVDKEVLEHEIASAEYEKQIREIRHKRSEDLRLARSDLIETVRKLLGQIDVWENDFVLRAPIDGIVAFYDFWTDQQFVAQGKSVFIIAPENSVLLGRMPVEQGGAGKIKPGQIVRMKLDDYPSKEFGVASGRVKSVSLVAQQGQQLVSVSINYPVVTSYGRTIAFKQEMTGEALVITDDRRLISRLFGEVRRSVTQPGG